ncbi:hypothetical protein NDU88_004841 [Pleurodeles waltl]|uniref:Uncharacterized protein n=1 Tax=Pleurodeles waltl TaxID=8319 RepID=A0AAV7PF75_PLEWA|nr:hypothetical protein NDU88_004841 [Pleurodeles waltl]
MPQSGSTRDHHLPRCSWAILNVLCPGARRASPKPRGHRSVRAVGHHGHDHPIGGPSIRRSSRSVGGPVLSSFRGAPPGPVPSHRRVPVFKVGVRYTRGPFRQPHRAACRVSALARLPAGPKGSGRARPCCFLLLARMGAEGPHAAQAAVTPSSAVVGARGFPRSAPQESLRSPATSRQEGGRPAFPAAVSRLPSNGARSHARPRARSLAQSGSRHQRGDSPQAVGLAGRLQGAPPGSLWAPLVLGSPTRVSALAPRQFAPGRWPRITGEVWAPPEQTDQACAIFGFPFLP